MTMNIQTFMEPIYAGRAVLGFSGWPDAGKLVHHTLGEIRRALPCEEAAVWDMDGFWHIESSRPHIVIEHGSLRRFDWPQFKFYFCRPDRGDPLIVGIGPEPACLWRIFSRQLLQQLKEWGCEEILLLGSLFDQIFHDEILISGVAQDARGINLLHELRCTQIQYSGPAAVHGAIMEEARKHSIFSLSLWAHLPFYMDSPHELLIAQLINHVGRLTRIPLDTHHLRESWKDREKQIEDSIKGDPELRRMMERWDRESGSMKSTGPARSKVIQFSDFRKHRNEFDTEEPGPNDE